MLFFKRRGEIISDVLGWSDTEEEIDEAKNEGELGTKVNENEEVNSNGIHEVGSSSTRTHSSVSHDENSSGLGRARRVPLWMQDYET
jgi:hypothetical protein